MKAGGDRLPCASMSLDESQVIASRDSGIEHVDTEPADSLLPPSTEKIERIASQVQVWKRSKYEVKKDAGIMATQNWIQEFIQTEFLIGDEHTVALDDELLLDGVLDSLGVMRLVAFIENHTGTPIPPQDVTVQHFHSISAIAEYLEHHTVGAP